MRSVRPWPIRGISSVVLVTMLLGMATRNGGSAWADEAQTAAGVTLAQCETWTPDPRATPVTAHAAGGGVSIAGNGTPICCGGWQFAYAGVQGGQAYRLHARVQHQGLDSPRDALVAMVIWERGRGETQPAKHPWNYLLPTFPTPETTEFEARVVAPADATAMTIRYAFRWSERGTSQWSAPAIEKITLTERKPVKVCVLNQTRQMQERIKIEPFSQGLGLQADVAKAVDVWASLAQAACRRQPQLLVTPELIISGRPLIEGAIAVPGPATRPFEKICREHQVYLSLGVKERAGDAVYNSAVLLGPDGKVVGVYRKVHLATSEGLSGLSAGSSFPVFTTPIGRIGCLICMDTTVSESARMIGLQGADFLCFPIMGDLRADRWSPGVPVFNEDRWKAIMRTRAIDNQLCMVVARNDVQGSCIIDRKGDILAWNEGYQEIIEATLPAADGYRSWDGGDFREITFLLRRPKLYQAYTDEKCIGVSVPKEAGGAR